MEMDLQDRDVRRLCEVIARLDDPDMVAAFLEDLCTIREIQDFAQRLSVAGMLDAGEPYTAISDKTGASATTIARVSKCLNHGAGGYRYVLDNIPDVGGTPPDGAAGPGA